MRNHTLSIFLSIALASSPLASADPQATAGSGSHSPYEIRTENELEAWLTHEPQDSPLKLLTADDRGRFLDSLYFSDKGLASFSYTPLDGLRPSELSRLLALFGVPSSLDTVLTARQERGSAPATIRWPPPDHDTGIDYKGYVCRSRGNCAKAEMDNICIGSNC
ncbi:hypothetical protein ABRP17_013060 [Stenotrophomonas sp. WHRI 8082]|uniref:hypothetical protein n=1 Tax=Stenotrophomonas sp. WHRI 8082 TaxID=3162571 RepID=UPI0032EC02AD